MKLTILPCSEGDLVYVECEGRISNPRAQEESAPVDAFLESDCGWRSVLLNLENTYDIDTSGLSWLMTKHSQLKQMGGKLIIYSVPDVVSRVIDMLKLAPNFHIAPNETAARELALRDRPPAPQTPPGSPAPVSEANYTIAGDTKPNSQDVFI